MAFFESSSLPEWLPDEESHIWHVPSERALLSAEVVDADAQTRERRNSSTGRAIHAFFLRRPYDEGEAAGKGMGGNPRPYSQQSSLRHEPQAAEAVASRGETLTKPILQPLEAMRRAAKRANASEAEGRA